MIKLYPYQEDGISLIKKFNGRALLSDEMGLGKTFQALSWIHQNNKWPAVVVCPAHLKWVWYSEALSKLGIRGNVLNGNNPSKIIIPVKNKLTIINYDILGGWKKQIKKIKAKTLVIDECHYIKNLNVLRTKRILNIAKKIPHIIAISGTPLLSRPIELFPVLHLLRKDLFPSFWDFAFRYCKPKATPHGWIYKGSDNLNELHSKLKRNMMIRRLKKDVMKELPDKTRQVIPVDIENMNEYQQAEKDFIKWLKKISISKALKANRTIVISKIGYLKRLSSQLKLKNIHQWIDNFLEESDQKLVIFGIHKKILKDIYNKHKSISVKIDGDTSQKKRKTAVKQFQTNKKTRLFIGNIIAAGTGITLTSAYNTLFVEMDWNPGNHIQAEDRTHRIGQKNAAFYYYLVAKNTIEEKLCEIIQNKQNIISSTLDGSNKTKLKLDVFNLLQKQIVKGNKKCH